MIVVNSFHNYYFYNSIISTQIKEAWDPKKSVKKNLEEMGISADPNQTFKIPKTKVRTFLNSILAGKNNMGFEIHF